MKPFMQRLWWRGRHFRDLRRAINEPWQDWADNVAEASTGLSAYAVNGSDPKFVADFAGVLNSGTPYFRVGGSTSSFASAFTFARASNACYLNSSGVWTQATTNTARTEHYRHNGSSWVRAGILLESAAATQLLHTTGTLVTQNVTVTAQPYTLHFSGTGTVTLSGASTDGPLVGTGTGEQNRVRLTFTPSAGTLTLTVSGTVSNAQLEAGSVPTSYIPNLAASGTVTRAADVLTVAGANMPYSATAMSFHTRGRMTYADDGGAGVGLWSWRTSDTDYIAATIAVASTRTGEPTITTENSNVLDQVTGSVTGYSPGVSVPFSLAYRITSSTLNLASGGTAATANTTLTGISNYSATAFQVGKGQNAFTNPPFVGTFDLIMADNADWGDAGLEEITA